MIEENNKNVVAEIETNENEEILRRKKAIEASRAEEKSYWSKTNKKKNHLDKESKPTEVKDQNKIPDNYKFRNT